jgi:hypothetical protein
MVLLARAIIYLDSWFRKGLASLILAALVPEIWQSESLTSSGIISIRLPPLPDSF